MFEGYTISVYLPCHNEEQGIGLVLDSIPRFVDEIVVVDNNSTDHSTEIARSKGAKIVVEKKQGYGAAHQRGTRSVKGDIICTGDTDGSYPFDQLEKILSFLIEGNYDFVSGRRFPLSDPAAMTRTSKIGNFALTKLIKILFRFPLNDSQSGMWCCRREALAKLKITSDNMAYTQEIKLEAVQHPEVKAGEVHIDYRPRVGQTKLSPLKDGWGDVVYLLRRKLNLLPS